MPPEGPPSSPSATAPAGGDTEIAEESDDDTDSEDEPELTLPTFPHDHEAEGSRDPPPPPQVTAAQVAMAADIATVLQAMMAQQQRSDERFERMQKQSDDHFERLLTVVIALLMTIN